MSTTKKFFNSMKNAIQYLKNMTTKTTKIEKIQTLEPLTTIITLAIISFKPIGTKIAVSSNKIYVQLPNVIQPALRWTYGNNREEIHYLLKPIFRAIKLYRPHEDDDMETIFKYAISGLKLLKNSYHNISSTLCHAIDLYINIIEVGLTGSDITIDIELLKTNHLNLSENTRMNMDKIFCDIWTPEEMKLISNMLKLSTKNENEMESYISAIESILETKKKLASEIIGDATKIL